jgi:hypothetical protein
MIIFNVKMLKLGKRKKAVDFFVFFVI